MGLAYKVLCGTRACNGGKFNYKKYLPYGNKPGKWLPKIKNVKVTEKGYHLTTEPHTWHGNRVFLCEYRDEDSDKYENNIAVKTFRFLKEVTIDSCIDPKIYVKISNLEGADLAGLDLSGVNLAWTNMAEANLQFVNLQDANLFGANLTGANLRRANLEHANLQFADLWWADLREANLERANLNFANLKGANLRGAYLLNMDVGNMVNWEDVDLRGANVDRHTLKIARAGGAVLKKSDLTPMTNRATMKLTFIDIFAGAGGLSEGFMREGFHPLAFIEKDANSCNTLKTRLGYYYLKNSGKIETYINYLKNKISRDDFYKHIPDELLNMVINEEIRDDTIGDIFKKIDNISNQKKVDVLIGGPPCQTYSIVGRSKMGNSVKNDKRNYLYKYYIEFLKKYKPSAFVFENVPGLLSAANGKYFKEIIAGFEAEGYTVHYKILNSADYGVLQNRKRVFVVGIKGEKVFTFPEPQPASGYTLRDLFCDLPDIKAGEKKRIVFYKEQDNNYLKNNLIRNELDFTTLHITRTVNKNDKKIYRLTIKKFLESGKQIKYTEIPKKLRTHKNQATFVDRFKVLNLNGISHTIVSHLSKDGYYYIYPNLKNPRSISVREAARIQSFPDDYFFEGSQTSCYQQIGNAVPVLLAQALAKQIKKI
ncbi:MAG: DNA (cytosine-5-)-methyltransferase [Thermoplasmata archaeon]